MLWIFLDISERNKSLKSNLWAVICLSNQNLIRFSQECMKTAEQREKPLKMKRSSSIEYMILRLISIFIVYSFVLIQFTRYWKVFLMKMKRAHNESDHSNISDSLF